MDNDRRLRRFARISLVLFYIVIIAGGIVRTTGSGMGCPDWPKCFGYYIPPTEITPLLFSPQHQYKTGQMVVERDTLWVANSAFVSADDFNRADWHKYPRHDYATFNPVQTWIEYVNRLATGVFALPVLLMVFFSFVRMRRRGDVLTFLLGVGAVVLIGFEAWLGKLVVDGNLKTSSITLHMIGSLAIVMCLIGILHRMRRVTLYGPFSWRIRLATWIGLLLAVVQIMLGTQVREETDHIAAIIEDRSQWVNQMSVMFYIHRSFSIAVALVVIWTWFLLRTTTLYSWGNALVALIAIEVLAGVVLTYFNMPAFMQPVHLLAAVMWFGLAVYLVIVTRGLADGLNGRLAD